MIDMITLIFAIQNTNLIFLRASDVVSTGRLAATVESPVCLDRMVRAQVCIYCNMLDAIKSWATKNHQNSELLLC